MGSSMVRRRCPRQVFYPIRLSKSTERGSKPAPGPQTGYATLVVLYGASHNACIAFFHIFMARSPLGGIGVKDVGRDFAPHKKNLQYQS